MAKEFIDRARAFVRAGNGGDGCTSFYTEKFINNGGPDGGDGGAGGNVIFMADARKTSLLDFKYTSHFRAENGQRGSGKFCHGKGGKDMIVPVPCGTVVRDEETGGILADLFEDGQSVVVLRGGAGGKGNARFKTSRRQAPHFAQTGQQCEEKRVLLELKVIADVGLVGFPNVGKSTLLSVISAAKPKIANYPFTTLSPNLGVASIYEQTFVVADIPGLIEGASDGAGLGIDFLRHIERTRLIVHVVDISGSEGRDPLADYRTINRELKRFSKTLASLSQVVALNKCELLPPDSDAIKRFKKAVRVPCMRISAVTHAGIQELLAAVANKLKTLPPTAPMQFEPFEYKRLDASKFTVSRDSDGAYEVEGGMMIEMARNVILDNYDSFNYFQKRLRDEGVIKALKKAGAGQGDTVRILDIEFEYVD